MSSKPPIAYMDIRVFSHATEDPEKVQAAAKKLFPDELAETILFEKTSLTGHHGNPIILFTSKLEDKKLLPKALGRIGQGLSSLDKEQLCTDLGLHIDKGNLYLRMDKQAAFAGVFRFSQNDPIHLKIHFKNKSHEQITDLCKSSGLLP